MLAGMQNVNWPGGVPPLPEALLWAAVGDLDVIERLSKHTHQVRIPSWSCRSCGFPWPCETARSDLIIDLGWTKVAIYSAVLMERSARDLPSLSPIVLWRQFIGWTEPPGAAREALLEQSE